MSTDEKRSSYSVSIKLSASVSMVSSSALVDNASVQIPVMMQFEVATVYYSTLPQQRYGGRIITNGRLIRMQKTVLTYRMTVGKRFPIGTKSQ